MLEPSVEPAQLASASLVLSEATWGDRDFTRQRLSRSVQAAGYTLRPRLEVENVEVALEITARGHADTIAARGVLRRMSGQVPYPLHCAPLRPSLHDDFAIVNRRTTVLSEATRALVRHAGALMQNATRADASEG